MKQFTLFLYLPHMQEPVIIALLCILYLAGLLIDFKLFSSGYVTCPLSPQSVVDKHALGVGECRQVLPVALEGELNYFFLVFCQQPAPFLEIELGLSIECIVTKHCVAVVPYC